MVVVVVVIGTKVIKVWGLGLTPVNKVIKVKILQLYCSPPCPKQTESLSYLSNRVTTPKHQTLVPMFVISAFAKKA